MKSKQYLFAGIAVLIISSFMVSGCAVNFYKQSPRSKHKIKELEAKLSELEAQRAAERKRFEEVENLLKKQLRDQINDENISLKMTDRGLVIVVSDEILFASGKAELKSNAYPVLDKVSSVIRKKVPDKNIGVGGHTDNVPIKQSNWKSNWELSTARATNVLHYLVKKGVSPDKLSATGYGEHKPIASNATASGRSKNRRVEIVILPQFIEEKADSGEYIK